MVITLAKSLLLGILVSLQGVHGSHCARFLIEDNTVLPIPIEIPRDSFNPDFRNAVDVAITFHVDSRECGWRLKKSEEIENTGDSTEENEIDMEEGENEEAADSDSQISEIAMQSLNAAVSVEDGDEVEEEPLRNLQTLFVVKANTTNFYALNVSFAPGTYTLRLADKTANTEFDRVLFTVVNKYVFSPTIFITFQGSIRDSSNRETPVHVTVGRGTYPHDFKGVQMRLFDEHPWAIEVGQFCSIGQMVTFLLSQGSSHDYQSISSYPYHWLLQQMNLRDSAVETSGRKLEMSPRNRTVRIGNDVWIGEGVQIVNSVTIGDGAVIGAYSVVRGDIPPYSVAAGNPARVVKSRFREDQVKLLQALRWWDWSDEEVRWALSYGNDVDGFLQGAMERFTRLMQQRSQKGKL